MFLIFIYFQDILLVTCTLYLHCTMYINVYTFILLFLNIFKYIMLVSSMLYTCMYFFYVSKQFKFVSKNFEKINCIPRIKTADIS